MLQIVDHAQRELWCLVENQLRPFVIRIPPTSYIYDLEELVLPMCRKDHHIRDLNHKVILLTKVRIAQASRSQV